eukprot:TRINITY_DN13317_c0_g1_i1.p1 TRINITY_DN13317_c0_g1~~TRINITY_DN13317_c0_g1_i1.p1  ORF type:complete len:482 (-),score=64.46 TRINITY_DN13317_c0_g1_i1:132-1577(-)
MWHKICAACPFHMPLSAKRTKAPEARDDLMPGDVTAYRTVDTADGKPVATASELESNFRWMSICFSVSHAVATTGTVIAASVLQAATANMGNGIFYLVSIGGTLLSPCVVGRLGAKEALRLTMILLSIYMGLFTCSIISWNAGAEALSARCWCVASIAGGFGTGIMWTAQGTYFAANCSLLAEARGETREALTASLASNFAVIYLTTEVIWKMSSAGLLAFGLPMSTLGVLGTAICGLTIVWIGEITGLGRSRTTADGLGKLRTMAWLWLDPLTWVLAPTAMCFGFSAALLSGHINAEYVTPQLGIQAPLFLSALTVIVAASGAKVFAAVEKVSGKGIVMMIGAASFGFVALILAAFHVAMWTHLLVIFFILQGMGRAVYESTLRSLFADCFAGDLTEAAFANLMLQSSFAMATCFFLEVSTEPITLQWIVISLASAMMASYPLSLWLRRKQPEGNAAGGPDCETPLVVHNPSQASKSGAS